MSSDGSLLISTLIPFEGTDGEDTTALSVGEMITKIQSLKQSLNAEREASALQQGKKPELLPQCEHLWVVSGVSVCLALCPIWLLIEPYVRAQCLWYENEWPTSSFENDLLFMLTSI